MGGGTRGGLFAVITLPVSLAAGPAVSGGKAAIALSAAGSSPSPDAAILEYQWTLLAVSGDALLPAATATGRVATVELDPSTPYEVRR